jgi:hypothetical protein
MCELNFSIWAAPASPALLFFLFDLLYLPTGDLVQGIVDLGQCPVRLQPLVLRVSSRPDSKDNVFIIDDLGSPLLESPEPQGGVNTSDCEPHRVQVGVPEHRRLAKRATKHEQGAHETRLIALWPSVLDVPEIRASELLRNSVSES